MSYDLYLLDLDGTLYRGSQVVPKAKETVAELRERGAKIAFLTNNSSQTRRAVAEKLERLGFEAHDHEVFTSGMAAAEYCVSHALRTAYVVGEEGLRSTLAEAGVHLVDAQPDAVVAGICRTFTYTDLAQAMACIRAGSTFVATNEDATYPVEDGRELPGAGGIVSAIRTASGVDPIVVGKPQPGLIEMALRAAGIPKHRALVVGDRIETDIEAGKRAGCATHLVLTGVTREAPEGQSWSEDLRGLL